MLKFLTLAFFTAVTITGAVEKLLFISTEHPRVTYFNPKYFSYINFTSRRVSRYDPKYYVDLHADTIGPFHNNVSVDFYFYEFLSNRYRRGFVEMHYKFCDLIHKDPFFGAAMKQGKLHQPCPYPPGEYHLYNMSIPTAQIPLNFPFTKGRIICNLTSRDNHDIVATGHIDMEIKTVNIRKKKEKSLINQDTLK